MLPKNLFSILLLSLVLISSFVVHAAPSTDENYEDIEYEITSHTTEGVILVEPEIVLYEDIKVPEQKDSSEETKENLKSEASSSSSISSESQSNSKENDLPFY